MKKVVIGMSGGVDSAVAALLLKKEGYDVIGLFMRNWDSTINNETNDVDFSDICPQEKDYNDAKKVCDVIGIPLHRVDFIKEYWDYVFTYFLNELKKGRTPNPDMLCNRYIKFDFFVKEAKKLGADYIATGHYARIKDGHLLRALDDNKDQTYFLADVLPDQLQNVLFPIGDYLKPDVRKIAIENNIPVAKKKDSTGICFIGERNYQTFIANFLKPNPGPIVDVETKKVIGTHKGLMNYTIGQRRNVGLSGEDKRHYVCGKNVAKNTLYIAFGDSDYLYSDACTITNLNFLSEKRPTECTAKFRYRSKDIPVKLEYHDDYLKVLYPAKEKAVTPGQACVLYLNDECLGCGFIDKIYNENQELWYLCS
jgi:tRNA-uridine 2-sulfurtransferase